MAIQVNEQAPDLDVVYPDAEGIDHNIATDLTNGPVLLGIYKSSCEASKAMMPVLNRFAGSYASHGLTVYGVAQDSLNVTRSFVRRSELNYPVLIEGDTYPVSVGFDIFATPSIYLLRQDGTVAYTTMGFLKMQINDISTAVAETLHVETVEIIGEADEDVPRFVPG